MAMSAIRLYHASPAFERSFRLRKIYFSRALTYCIVASASDATVLANNFDTVAEGFFPGVSSIHSPLFE